MYIIGLLLAKNWPKCRFGVPCAVEHRTGRLKKLGPMLISTLWPPNSPYLNPVDYSVWSILQENVYKTRITDLDDLKHRISTEWAELGHAVIAAAVRQWRGRLSACV